jgi:ubiquinone/menaquinone biosynthesis C-methylase UbiE
MTSFYKWVYKSPKQARRLDRNWIIKLLLFFQDKRLISCYLNQVKQGTKVWQVANVYGDLICKVAQKIGQQGFFYLTDISAVQIRRCRSKLANYPWTKIIHTDAAAFRGTPPYDLICSFFLLHEIPDNKKCEIVNNMLSLLSKGGQAIFIDYHRPALWHPIRYILIPINLFLEPFCSTLWKNEIQDFASCANTYTWTKHTIFGGVYQCVIAKPVNSA